MPNDPTETTGFWDCDCGRECRHKDGPERLSNCRAEWVSTAPVQTLATEGEVCRHCGTVGTTSCGHFRCTLGYNPATGTLYACHPLLHRKAGVMDYLLWIWLTIFRPRVFRHLYGDRRNVSNR